MPSNRLKIQTPMIVINYKTYLEGTGKRGLEIAKQAEKVASDLGVSIAVAPQFVDIPKIAEACSVPVYAQHVDPIEPGAHTGHVLPAALAAAGASGAILNHSERRMKMAEIEHAIQHCQGAGLISLVCSSTASMSGAVSIFGPEIIAIEPPELIGSGVAVSKAKPEVVTATIKEIRRINQEATILCGAGITQPDDVRAAIKLGTLGILVSSAIVKSKDPASLTREFANALL